MAGPPPGFMGALARKYDIEQQQADASGNLQRAQAANITALTPAQIAQMQSQSELTRANAAQVAPLAAASIGVSGAQAGLLGAQGQQITRSFGPAGPLFGDNAARLMEQSGTQWRPNGPPPLGNTTIPIEGDAGGTDMVGHYAAGDPNVQGMSPGDRLRARLGMGHFAKGTAHVSARHSSQKHPLPMPHALASPPPMAPAGAPAPVQTAQSMPGPMGPPGQGPGLAAMLQAAMGANRVPGHGDGSVDTVPAVLAPGEAVLNRGAAEHMGRGRIAAANEQGARHMAAQGHPPQSPPTQHGHYAGGVPSVPAPGQTITNGSWGPSAPPPTPPPVSPNPFPPLAPGSVPFGRRINAAGGASDVQPPEDMPPPSRPMGIGRGMVAKPGSKGEKAGRNIAVHIHIHH